MEAPPKVSLFFLIGKQCPLFMFGVCCSDVVYSLCIVWTKLKTPMVFPLFSVAKFHFFDISVLGKTPWERKEEGGKRKTDKEYLKFAYYFPSPSVEERVKWKKCLRWNARSLARMLLDAGMRVCIQACRKLPLWVVFAVVQGRECCYRKSQTSQRAFEQ